jgi:cyclic pyranopterin phosphate synthase
MVDISGKPPTFREAEAEGLIRLKPETLERIRKGLVEKGNPLDVARIMGTLAAKETSKIIALCHPISITNVKVDFDFIDERTLKVKVLVRAEAKTGVEMEALTATASALLNIWDMVKMYEKDEEGQYPHTEILSIRVKRKVKGKP